MLQGVLLLSPAEEVRVLLVLFCPCCFESPLVSFHGDGDVHYCHTLWPYHDKVRAEEARRARHLLVHKDLGVRVSGHSFHQPVKDGIVPFPHQASVGSAGIESVSQRFPCLVALLAGGVQMGLATLLHHRSGWEQVQPTPDGKSVLGKGGEGPRGNPVAAVWAGTDEGEGSPLVPGSKEQLKPAVVTGASEEGGHWLSPPD